MGVQVGYGCKTEKKTHLRSFLRPPLLAREGACPCTLQGYQDSLWWMLRRWRRGSALAQTVSNLFCGRVVQVGRGYLREETLGEEGMPADAI